MSDPSEGSVISVAPPPLPRFQGAVRFQAALDQDRIYRLLVLGALLVAGLAGAGFGTLASRAGSSAALLWSLMAAGLIVRCMGRRGGLAFRFDWRDIAILTATSLVLGAAASFVQLADTLQLVASAALAGGGLLLVERVGAVSRGAGTGLALLLAALLGSAMGYWTFPTRFGLIVLAVALAVGAMVSTWRPGSGLEPVIGLTRAAGIGWALLAWGGGGGEFHLPLAVIALVLALALDLWSEQRRSFSAVAAIAAFLQLATLPPAEQLLLASLWLQPVCSVAAFLALVVAGWRFMTATRLLHPAATYRIAPLCVVPRFDRGLDHPVKISVA